MRIVSLVPSLTETLVRCGLCVVGRSRFCIHPEPQISAIPRVGGTKDVKWERVAALAPDLIVLDKEENTREMAETCPFPYVAVQINSVEAVAPELRRLALAVETKALAVERQALVAVAERWERACELPVAVRRLRELPGVVDWWRPPGEAQDRLEYLIWRDPWMAIGPGTFIHSMLCRLGVADCLRDHRDKYPVVDLAALDRLRTVLLFSTEPFHFERYREAMTALGFACGLIDGELYSWYGVRSLEFLEAAAVGPAAGR